ncbi:MAG: IS1380 family transposase [Mycobacteriales bacterium]|nr:IS1380 family transposase [Mycobacteriales bacterium]
MITKATYTEFLTSSLRPGNANANNAADHITVLGDALAQIPEQLRDRVVVRGDSGAGTHDFVDHVSSLGLGYSVGIGGWATILDALDNVPRQAWKAALDPDGFGRDGAQVAELTRYVPTATGTQRWPSDMRVIARRERPHPGAQLRITDRDGWRITVFATNQRGRLADLEVQHRLRARAEDRIRNLKDTGLRNLPLHDLAQNQIWLELVALASDLLAWTQRLALAHTTAVTWEPKRLRFRLLNVAGRVVRTARRDWLRLPRGWPWNNILIAGHERLHALNS